LLIIFDLDDTLIDTSGSIVPFRLDFALQRMIKAGLSILDFDQALSRLKAMDETAHSTKEALGEFLEIQGASSGFLEIGCKAVYDHHEFSFPVLPTEAAPDALLDLYKKHTLAIVSIGTKEIQFEKMKKAGIDTSLFSRIIICQDPFKKQSYHDLMEDLGVTAQNVIVVGDRIKRDLAPAKALGCKTVHMKWGRGLHQKGDKEEIDFSITSIDQLRSIITQLENT
jgi:putative hydrolase of the HAD superfamily